MRQILPVADGPTVRRYAGALLRTHPGALGLTLGLHALAAIAALAVPWLLGDLVNGVQNGTTQDTVDRTAILIAISVVTAAVFTAFARWA
jgi:ABC-type multidrug transport system fused ATPase/permease subunit